MLKESILHLEVYIKISYSLIYTKTFYLPVLPKCGQNYLQVSAHFNEQKFLGGQVLLTNHKLSQNCQKVVVTS